MLIDTHAHLTDEQFDYREIVKNMPADGLERIVTVAYDLPSSYECARIARENQNVFCAVGVHPNDSQKLTADPCEELYALATDKQNKVVAIGEIGLDYHYDGTDKEVQKKWMARQIALSDEVNLPPAFHIRDAYEDMFAVMKECEAKLKRSGIMHCYSGSKQVAVELSKKYDFYFSFSGSITFKNAYKFPDIIKALPKDRLLIETDCPYLTPHPYRGKLNMPCYVQYTAARMAEILEMDYLEVVELTSQNAKRLLKL